MSSDGRISVEKKNVRVYMCVCLHIHVYVPVCVYVCAYVYISYFTVMPFKSAHGRIFVGVFYDVC